MSAYADLRDAIRRGATVKAAQVDVQRARDRVKASMKAELIAQREVVVAARQAVIDAGTDYADLPDIAWLTDMIAEWNAFAGKAQDAIDVWDNFFAGV